MELSSILQLLELLELVSGVCAQRRVRLVVWAGVSCDAVQAGSWARRSALWGRSRREPSFRCPRRRHTSLGAIRASSGSCAR